LIIIGEKINGSIPSTAKAIESRDETFIRDMAKKQTEFGANYIDVNAGTRPEIERETLRWLMDLVQGTVDTPLCIDSSDVDVIIDMLPFAKRPGMINSVSEEHSKCERLMPKIADTEWNLVALTCDADGIPTEAKDKFKIASSIIEKAESYGIKQSRLFVDPLVMTIGSVQTSLLSFNEAVKLIKDKFPDVHITSGLSNISHGMPYRKIINQSFLILAMAAGMDSAVMDPTSRDMQAALYTTKMLLGQDMFCMEFISAFREGIFGPQE
jgi:5-methyltetrahydrofolate--homocysteine methyltransferase